MLIQKENTLRGNRGPETEEFEDSWDDLAIQYQHMIEVRRWLVEVKRVDLTDEVSFSVVIQIISL